MNFSRPETAEEREGLRLILGPSMEPIFDAICDGVCSVEIVSWGEIFTPPDASAYIAILRDGTGTSCTPSRGCHAFHLESIIFGMLDAQGVAVIATHDTWSGPREALVYRMAAEATRKGQSVFIIETGPKYGEAWIELVTTIMPWMPLIFVARQNGEDAR